MQKRMLSAILFITLAAFLFTLLAASRVAAQPAAPLAPPTPPAGLSAQEAAVANKLIQERRNAHQAQLDELSRRIEAASTLVADLAAQKQALAGQLAGLEQVRSQRAAAYQAQLAGLETAYAPRLAQYAAQLQEAQARLSEANAQSGR